MVVAAVESLHIQCRIPLRLTDNIIRRNIGTRHRIRNRVPGQLLLWEEGIQKALQAGLRLEVTATIMVQLLLLLSMEWACLAVTALGVNRLSSDISSRPIDQRRARPRRNSARVDFLSFLTTV